MIDCFDFFLCFSEQQMLEKCLIHDIFTNDTPKSHIAKDTTKNKKKIFYFDNNKNKNIFSFFHPFQQKCYLREYFGMSVFLPNVFACFVCSLENWIQF